MNEYYAHLYGGRKELLIDHLHNTADLAESFSSEFGSGPVGRQLGLLHDVGKHTRYFQEVLNRKRIGINHAVVGSQVYYQECRTGIIPSGKLALILCMCISCHHSTLHSGDYSVPSDFKSLMYTLTDDREKINAVADKEEWEEILSYIQKEQLLIKIKKGDYLNIKNMTPCCKMFYARMLFSCLVDADYTASAVFENECYNIDSQGVPLEPEKRLLELKHYREQAFSGKESTPMSLLREQVFKDAQDIQAGPGVYTMTAPTGTGKTLALIAFALSQAARNKQKRIFVVLPYLSIINQNAAIYRSIFGDDVVLEQDSQTEYTEKTKLLSERWSAPIIITTNVNFCETLFRVKPTRVRALHQVSNSVIIFDEAQTLPLSVTDVTMEIMKELSENYGSTILFSTATQPAYQYRKYLAKLPFHTTEVIRDCKNLFKQYNKLKKTETIFSTDRTWDYEDLASYYEGKDQVLYIFNTIAKSQNMYEVLKPVLGDSLFYLSSSLCPRHRLDTLDHIKERLDAGMKVWLVSTQCIESGVDIDFPYGAREFSPYTSIVQSAGRINRNGTVEGKLLVFLMEDQGRSGYPGAQYKNESMISLSMAKQGTVCLNDLETVNEYYRILFTGSSGAEEDKREIREALQAEDYEELSDAYQLIEQKGQDIIIVPYDIDLYEEAKRKLEENKWSLTKGLMRELHDITVSVNLKKEMKVFCRQLNLLTHQGPELTNWYILEDPEKYSQDLGFKQTTEIGDAFFL